eukprot:CAMPEP_0180800748 /NCGR_PEP_ID=MMETSP1038_2-20121128/59256_1 /TAXON_ID=632150 /ORGANISM="Azadinium spinosum, Strain 3D9" /LENGTH=101 /DNA_ID=CAMNT_0022840471 /DNA_START=63 /DNA_END=368 /DNA_ORIENTATION=+
MSRRGPTELADAPPQKMPVRGPLVECNGAPHATATRRLPAATSAGIEGRWAWTRRSRGQGAVRFSYENERPVLPLLPSSPPCVGARGRVGNAESRSGFPVL